MPTESDLPYLIQLLDDKDPAVRPIVREHLSEFGGDISHDLAALGISIKPSGRKRLSRILEPGRRQTLRNDWLIPTGGALALGDDWESFENILRQISDFLHDGFTLRPSLPDSLDLLTDEIREDMAAPSANELRQWLFCNGRFKGVQKNANAEKYYDICHVIDSRHGNPTSLGCLFMLLGHRLGVQVDGCSYPEHFLTKIQIEGRSHLVDCFHDGRQFDIEVLLETHPEISVEAQAAVFAPNHLGVILLRYVTEMQHSFSMAESHEHAALFKELAETLEI